MTPSAQASLKVGHSQVMWDPLWAYRNNHDFSLGLVNGLSLLLPEYMAPHDQNVSWQSIF